MATLRAGPSASDQTDACFYYHPGEAVVVKLQIVGATGAVKSAIAEGPNAGTDVGNCVEAVLKWATFKKFQKASDTRRYRVAD